MTMISSQACSRFRAISFYESEQTNNNNNGNNANNAINGATQLASGHQYTERSGSSRSTTTQSGSANQLHRVKRKLCFSEAIFKNLKFFLDIQDGGQVEKLKDDISSMGGQVETFLMKEIDYIVTDRRPPPQLSASQQQHQKPHLRRSGEERLKSVYFSRGQQMIQKSQKMKENSIDIFELAKKFQIKMISFFKFEEMIRREKPLKKPKGSGRGNAAAACATAALVALCVQKLQGFYFKLETNGTQSKPLLHRLDDPAKFSAVETPKNAPKQDDNEEHPVQHVLQVPSQSDSRGFCELCQLNFMKYKHHLKGDCHQTKSREDSNFLEIDQLIRQLTSLPALNAIYCSDSNAFPRAYSMESGFVEGDSWSTLDMMTECNPPESRLLVEFSESSDRFKPIQQQILNQMEQWMCSPEKPLFVQSDSFGEEQLLLNQHLVDSVLLSSDSARCSDESPHSSAGGYCTPKRPRLEDVWQVMSTGGLRIKMRKLSNRRTKSTRRRLAI